METKAKYRRQRRIFSKAVAQQHRTAKPAVQDRGEEVILAQPGDEGELLELFRMAHAENGFNTMSEKRVIEAIQAATLRRGGMIGVIRGPDTEAGPGKIEGALGVMLSRMWYTDDWHLEELLNYVHPDHRRSTHAKKLLRFAKWAAQEMNQLLLVAVMTTERMEAKVDLYQRELTMVGAVFAYGPSTRGYLSVEGE
jgi:GNAT superfamily N-acetyltransferase